MSGERNPFRLRTAENIQSEAEFLRLFGPRMLEVLPDSQEWHKLTVIESSPGGGKTTLFKLLTPKSLKQLVSASRDDDDLQDLQRRLERLDFVDNGKPNVLGVFLSCARNFAALEDLGLEDTESTRLFNALLNSRIILSTLRSSAEFYSLDYPDELEKLEIDAPPEIEPIPDLEYPKNGQTLFEWACEAERKVCAALDSFEVVTDANVVGHQSIYSLSLLEPGRITYDGIEYPSHSLIMLDDAHQLSEHQRTHLLRAIANYRANVRIWVSQRLVALRPDEVILGATEGREYEQSINIEEFWHQHQTKFQKLLREIGNRRTQRAKSVDVTSFSGQLADNLDKNRWRDNIAEARETIESRVRDKAEHTDSFDEWIQETEEQSTGEWEKAIDWRALEIKIKRQQDSSQQMLDVGVPLAEKTLNSASDSVLLNAAEKLLSEEFDLPYYYGPERLAYLSSFNIDQYLSVSGDLFEQISSRHLLNNRGPLPAETQDELIREWAELQWEEIPRSVPRGDQVQQLLGSIGEMCRDKWVEGTASYGGAGALSGIGIRYPEVEKIVGQSDDEHGDGRSYQSREVLVACIANNLIEARPHKKQGRKGQEVLILYLNRWICAKYNLPLLYGGWRPKKARDLEKAIPSRRVV